MRMRRRLLIPVIALGGLVVAVAGSLLALPFVELGPFVAGRVAAALGRGVRVGSLRVTPGRWVRMELRDLAVADLAGGTRADMLTVASLVAEVDLFSLPGPVTVRGMALRGVDLLLERVGEVPNWKSGDARPRPGPDYSRFPTLLDAVVEARITVRTRSGKALVTTLDGVRIAAEGAAQPVRLAGPASYQGVPIAADIVFASADAIRAAPRPVASTITLVAEDTRLVFQGSMTAPLDVDGAQGELTYDAPTPGATLRLVGATPMPLPPLHLVGTLERNDPEWHLANTTGTIGASAIRGGDLDLVEGRPDKLAVTLDLDALDLDALLGPRSGTAGEPGLVVERNPGTLLDLKLSAASLSYAGVALVEPSLDAAILPGRVEVSALGFGALGGQVRGSGRIENLPGDAAARVSAELTASGVELQGLRRALGLGTVPVTGRLDAALEVSGEGATLRQAERASRGAGVLTMRGGSIAREVVELASTDARALFRTARGMVAVTCALGILELRGGVVAVSPLRIRTPAGTIVGRGRLDLLRQALDVTVASESATTGLFALDVPVHVTGAFADPGIAPAALSAEARAQLAAPDAVGRLPPGLRDDARRSPCLERAR